MDRKIRQNGTESDYDKFCEEKCIAIEHLIKAYKELEEENKTLNERNQYLVKYRAKLEKELYESNENFIPVSLVEEKIEELSDELEIMKVDAMYGRFKEYGSKLSFEKIFSYKYGMHDILQELLEKR